MADTWTVTPTSVLKNGNPIISYVAHALTVRYNTEGTPFAETSLVVRIRDAPSEAARQAPLLTLPTATAALVIAEYAAHPAFTEFRSKPGDTINFSGAVTAGAGMQPGTLAGGDPL